MIQFDVPTEVNRDAVMAAVKALGIDHDPNDIREVFIDLEYVEVTFDTGQVKNVIQIPIRD